MFHQVITLITLSQVTLDKVSVTLDKVQVTLDKVSIVVSASEI